MRKYLPDGICTLNFLLQGDFLIIYCDKFCLLTTYTFKTTTIQRREYKTRSKEAINITNISSKIRNNLMIYINDIKHTVANLEEVIIKIPRHENVSCWPIDLPNWMKRLKT